VQNSHRLPFNAGNSGSRLRVAITLRCFDAHFASKVQGRKISRVVKIFDFANNFHEDFVLFKIFIPENPQLSAKLLRGKNLTSAGAPLGGNEGTIMRRYRP